MLFNTWPFGLFLLLVLPVFFALRKTRLWLPWLLLASYIFYGWWNPYYLVIVLYSTSVVYWVVALMDHCPVPEQKVNGFTQRLRLPFADRVMRAAFIVSLLAALGLFIIAWAGPPALRPTVVGLGLIALFMTLGALYRRREGWLVIGMLNALAPLLFFKYARFIAENANTVLSWFHLSAKLADPGSLMPYGGRYLLPIGISFYTFQALGYLIDCYVGKVERERNWLRFANFVCFFPQLMAGPLERAGHLLPQFQQFPPVRLRHFTDGLSLFLVGLFKKVALAGYLSLYVDRVYDNPKACGAPALLLGTLAFGWQIYFDFSGYSDMARGVAKLMGFNLVLNFNHPYLADSLADFWRRWHISFSRWILDYIFMPLQMQWRDWRWPRVATASALVATFLVSGIWHGAAWTFIIWGALHGLGLAGTRELERSAFYRKRVPKLCKQAGVFSFVSLTWIFFRADTLSDAWLIVRHIFTAVWQDPQIPALMLAWVALVWLYQGMCESRLREMLKLSFVRVGLAVFMICYLCFCSSGGGKFIYFQF